MDMVVLQICKKAVVQLPAPTAENAWLVSESTLSSGKRAHVSYLSPNQRQLQEWRLEGTRQNLQNELRTHSAEAYHATSGLSIRQKIDCSVMCCVFCAFRKLLHRMV